jgi:hypothetical protein
MFLRAIDDGTHAFLEGKILSVEPANAGEARMLLQLAIDEVIVRKVPLQLEGTGN